MKKVLGFILGLSFMLSMQTYAQIGISSVTVPTNVLATGDTVTVSLVIQNDNFSSAYLPSDYPARVSVGLPTTSQILRLAGSELYGQNATSFSTVTSTDAFNFQFSITDSIPAGDILRVSFKLLAIAPTSGTAPEVIVQLQYPDATPPGTDFNRQAARIPFTITGNILPVSLLDFNARKEGNKAVALSWKTVSETNNSGFAVERSSDSRSWNEIGFVASQSKSGNSDGALSYSFSDQAPLMGQNLYRLKQVDLDGQYVYSSVQAVSFDSERTFSIYPNPARDMITVAGLTGNEMIYIYDIAGRPVVQQKANAAMERLLIDRLPEGVYNVHISGPDGVRFTQKFIKAK